MEIYCILRHAEYTLFYFPQNVIYFVSFVFLCSSNKFFMKSVQKFKYQQSFKSSGLVFMKCVLCLQHVSIYAAYLYDAVMLYARALDKLLKNYTVVTDQILDEVSRNGTRIIEMLKNDTYDSKCRGLCATTHSSSHLALDVSFCG
jgi:hypothetical protein